jgi:hypothetical protein
LRYLFDHNDDAASTLRLLRKVKKDGGFGLPGDAHYRIRNRKAGIRFASCYYKKYESLCLKCLVDQPELSKPDPIDVEVIEGEHHKEDEAGNENGGSDEKNVIVLDWEFESILAISWSW